MSCRNSISQGKMMFFSFSLQPRISHCLCLILVSSWLSTSFLLIVSEFFSETHISSLKLCVCVILEVYARRSTRGLLLRVSLLLFWCSPCASRSPALSSTLLACHPFAASSPLEGAAAGRHPIMRREHEAVCGETTPGGHSYWLLLWMLEEEGRSVWHVTSICTSFAPIDFSFCTQCLEFYSKPWPTVSQSPNSVLTKKVNQLLSFANGICTFLIKKPARARPQNQL